MRPFFDVLRDIRKGECIAELDEQLAKLQQAVSETNKAGELTLKIKIQPAQRDDATQVFITDEVRLKEPRLPKAATLFFASRHGFTRRDPNQVELDLKSVPKTAEASTANTEQEAKAHG